MFCSLSLRSGFPSVHISSLHTLLFRPRSADEASFSNPQFAQLFSIILPSLFLSAPPSSIVNRNHLLIDSVGQLASTVITADWCHTDMLQVPPTEKRSPTHHHFVTKTQHFQSLRFIENLCDYIIILYLHTPLCSASQLSKLRREVDVVLRVCFAFSALTRRF